MASLLINSQLLQRIAPVTPFVPADTHLDSMNVKAQLLRSEHCFLSELRHYFIIKRSIFTWRMLPYLWVSDR